MKKILAFLFALPLLFACTPDHLRISMDSATVLTRDADVISDDSAVLYGERLIGGGSAVAQRIGDAVGLGRPLRGD